MLIQPYNAGWIKYKETLANEFVASILQKAADEFGK